MKARIEDGVVYSPYPPIDIPVCSFYALAKEVLLTNPEKTALVDDVASVTRAEVLSRMRRYAVGFRRNGISAGDRVCVHLKNSVENLLALYGCILAGATVVLAKASLQESELCYQASDSDSVFILTEGLFCMGDTSGFVSAADFPQLDENEYQEYPIADPKSTVLAVCYTSGSTGMPKGVEMTHYSYVASFYTTSRSDTVNELLAKLIQEYLPARRDRDPVTQLPDCRGPPCTELDEDISTGEVRQAVLALNCE
ncbi:hypothetical protein HPB50_006801 [Hyalomma asiaticum]|uniref:Uncharacterized protein n=1 Tax=Hyalomma asiaticum TaxID=266040 RepID=A0ACB7SNC8_HYAAI|nr:hypothetical protein HPB50_006801 [Hyalomma asiaticum]